MCGNSQVAILAGGMGTRLRDRTGNLPKPMAPIMGKPVLEHQIVLCKKHGFDNIALLVHYQSDSIREYFGDGSRWGVQLTYVVEAEARGTAGALRDALSVMAERFLVLYADTYADIDLGRLWQQADMHAGAGTLLLHPNDHPADSDLVVVEDNGLITAMRPYPHPEGSCFANLVNAALYVLDKNALIELIPLQGKSDLAKHTFPSMLAAGHQLWAYITPEYIKDMGTPERLDKVERDVIRGLPERLSTRQLRRAVFLDRDGTLNIEVNHLSNASQLQLLPGVGHAVHRLNRDGLLAVCVTNQPVIARGDVSEGGIREIHAKLDDLLGRDAAYLDRLYLCPHHPDSGFEGEIPSLKVDCACRKPKTGLIDRAVSDLNIDRRQSWMIGDTTSDMLAAERAGLRSILVQTGFGGRDAKYPVLPDYVCDDLASAVDWILSGHSKVASSLMPIAAEALDARIVLIGGPARSGKSMSAQVLRELMIAMGRVAHIVPLDCWLNPPDLRKSARGVLDRYNLAPAIDMLSDLMHSSDRVQIHLPHSSWHKACFSAPQSLSVGPSDLLIVEGVPALLHPDLRSLTQYCIHIEASAEDRRERFFNEYRLRGMPDHEIAALVRTREEDEVRDVLSAAAFASHTLRFRSK